MNLYVAAATCTTSNLNKVSLLMGLNGVQKIVSSNLTAPTTSSVEAD